MRARIRMMAIVSTFLLAAACASSGAGTAGTGSNAVTPPKVLSPAAPTIEFNNIADVPTGTVTFQVWVDTFGKPDMRTLSFSGPSTGAYEDAIKRWLSAATFQPATQAGVPTRGLYENHTTFKGRRRY